MVNSNTFGCRNLKFKSSCCSLFFPSNDEQVVAFKIESKRARNREKCKHVICIYHICQCVFFNYCIFAYLYLRSSLLNLSVVVSVVDL